MALGDVLSRLSVELGLNSAAFERGARRSADATDDLGDRMEHMGDRVGRVTKAAIGLGAAFAGSQVVGKLYDMAQAGLATASALGEQATQLGVSTSALQRYRFIASQIGVEQEEMDKGLSKLSLSLGKLSLDVGKSREKLEKFGFTSAEVASLSKLSSEDALPILADKYKALSSETERAAFVAEFFGSKLGGKFKTLLEGGAAGVNELAEAYKKLGIEISPEQIAAADKAMDLQAQNQLVLQAKIAQLSGQNAEQITKASLAWEQFKIDALDAFISTLPYLENFSDSLGSVDATIRKFGKESGFHAFIDESGRKFQANVRATGELLSAIYNLSIKAPEYVRNMVTGIGSALTGKLASIMDGAKAQFEKVRAGAFDMWDKVSRRSYVPDMVDDIAREMARLDDVMVAPAKKATDAAKRSFEKLRDEVRPILERLFPEQASANAFANDNDAIAKAVAGKAISAATGDEAKLRLSRERAGVPVDGPGESVYENIAPIIPAIDKIDAALGILKDKSAVTTVAVAKSFKDMADATLASLSSLSSAIKGGGFLNILQSVIGLGLQLGSIGAFGKTIQGRISAPKTPGYATGTMSAARGLALVGERGPELVNFSGGERVWPSGTGPGGSRVVHNHFTGNLLTPEFWAQINAGDERAARTGAGLAHMQNARSRQWSLG